MRLEFASSVKNILAARAGHRCSNPDCRAPTSGPQLDEAKAVNLGVAAHITAASAGGPRFDAALSPAERADINNAIWLCQNCGKLVDNDPQRFSVQLLNSWRRDAESRASLQVGKSAHVVYGEASASAETAIKHKLELRDALQSALLCAPEERRKRPSPHP